MVKINYEKDTLDQEVRIEIIPLIDVIFCILTFFILAAVTLTRQSAINVDLPRASTGATQMGTNMLVSVDPIGQIYIDDKPVSKEQLYQALVDFKKSRPEGLMVLSASRSASYNDVVQVLDLLRSVGGDRVALGIIPGASDSNNLPSSLDTPGLGGQPNFTDPNQIPGLSNPLPGSTLPGSTSPNLNSPGLNSPGISAPSNGTDSLGIPGLNSPSQPGSGTLPGVNSPSGTTKPSATPRRSP